MSRWKLVLLSVFGVIVALLVVLSLTFYVALGAPSQDAETFVLVGNNMAPTLVPGERILCDPHVSVAPGRIVVLDDPSGLHQALVSRVIAVSGQEIDIRDGKVLVNGEALDEPYLDDVETSPGMEMLPALIPEGELWFMGDNRPISGDSRFIGPVPVSSVHGVVTYVYWPPSSFRKIETP